MHGALSSALWIQGLFEQKIIFPLDSTLKSLIEISTQAQLMVVIEGKQKEAAATEEVVSKALPKNISQPLNAFDLTMVILWLCYDWDEESCEFSGCGRNSQSGGECQQHENGLPARHQVLLMTSWPMDVNDRKSYHILPACTYFCTPRRSESRHATIPRSCDRLGCWGGTWTKPCRLSTLPLRWTELWCAHAWEEPGCAHDAHVMRIRKVQDKSFWHCTDMG